MLTDSADVLTGNTVGGYSCGSCGIWVPYGKLHICSNRPYPPGPPYPDVDKTDALIAAIDRLAMAIERLEKLQTR